MNSPNKNNMEERFDEQFRAEAEYTNSDMKEIKSFIQKELSDQAKSIATRIRFVLETFVWDMELGDGDEVISVMENRKAINEMVKDLLTTYINNETKDK